MLVSCVHPPQEISHYSVFLNYAVVWVGERRAWEMSRFLRILAHTVVVRGSAPLVVVCLNCFGKRIPRHSFQFRRDPDYLQLLQNSLALGVEKIEVQDKVLMF